MAAPFSAFHIANMRCANRFLRSATWEGMADEFGGATQALAGCFAGLARGGVGVIVTGHAFVTRQGQVRPRQLGADDEIRLPGLSSLAAAVHKEGAALALQLAHGGCRAGEAYTGMDAVGAWPIYAKTGDLGRAMTLEEIAAVPGQFARAAALAAEAGFDAVQIHAAHGYMLSQFLSPHYNKRKDAYGGSPENRARLVREVVAAVKEAAGGMAVLIKINSEDFLPGGLKPEESLEAVASLEALGLDAVEISGGTMDSGRLAPVRPVAAGGAYYLEAARLFRKRLSIPIILTGGIRTYAEAEAILAEGAADLIGLSRPLIREPGLVGRWMTGNHAPSPCVSDNLCFKPALDGRGIACLTAEREAARSGQA